MVSNLQIQRSPTAASHQAHSSTQVVSGGEMGMGQSEAQDRSVVAALQDIKMALQSSKTTNPHDRHGLTDLSATRIPPSSSSEVVSDGLADPWHSRTNGNRRGQPNSMDYSTSQVPPPLTVSELEDNLEDEDEDDEDEEDEEEDDDEEEVGSDELEDEDEDEEEEEGEDIEEGPEDVIEERVPTPKNVKDNEDDLDTDQETDRLLGQQYNDDKGYFDSKVGDQTILSWLASNFEETGLVLLANKFSDRNWMLASGHPSCGDEVLLNSSHAWFFCRAQYFMDFNLLLFSPGMCSFEYVPNETIG